MGRSFFVQTFVAVGIALAPQGAGAMQDLTAGDRPIDPVWAGRSAVYAKNGAAATAHPLATQIAIDILQEGGSAVDAAIAANAALGLMEPTGCGVGGDLFAIVWDPKTEKLYGLNGSGRSPMGQTLDDLRAKIGEDADEIPPYGPLPVTVPGTVDAWFELHDRFGEMSMKKVLRPAIRYAEDGFPMAPYIGFLWDRSIQNFRRVHERGDLPEVANAMATYAPEGAAPPVGATFRNPDLAKTYRRLARKGRKAFYDGDLTEVMVGYLQSVGSALTEEDFENHASEWVEPLSVNYRGYDVWELPPNGQGAAVLQMMKILERFDLEAMGEGSPDALHVMIEAKRLVYEDLARAYADPEFAPFPAAELLSDDYAEKRAALIDMARANPDVTPGEPALIDGDTTYLTVADKNGMMVSLIQSNYRGMGSGLVPDGLGFMFQDRGQLFSLTEGHPNVYAPGKRPFHTIIPAFVTKDGQPWMSFGLMGGDMQPQGHAQILVNMIDFGLDVQSAGDAARFRHVGSTEATGDLEPAGGYGELRIESGISAAARAELRARGHTLQDARFGFGGYQAIRRLPDGTYAAASERRKDGAAGGY